MILPLYVQIRNFTKYPSSISHPAPTIYLINGICTTNYNCDKGVPCSEHVLKASK